MILAILGYWWLLYHLMILRSLFLNNWIFSSQTICFILICLVCLFLSRYWIKILIDIVLLHYFCLLLTIVINCHILRFLADMKVLCIKNCIRSVWCIKDKAFRVISILFLTLTLILTSSLLLNRTSIWYLIILLFQLDKKVIFYGFNMLLIFDLKFAIFKLRNWYIR
jgi:hypothetical protein